MNDSAPRAAGRAGRAVRSAPLRRRRKVSRPEEEPAPKSAAGTADTPADAADTADVTAPAAPDTADVTAPAAPDTADVTAPAAPDEEAVAAPAPAVSYRERRRARIAARPAASGDRRGIRYRGKTSLPVRSLMLGGAAILVIIACVAAAIAFAIGINRYERQDELRAEYSAFARDMIVNLTTLNPDNVDAALKTMESKTSGRAREMMQDSMKQATGLVRDQKYDTRSTVMTDAVVNAEPDQGSVILVYGWEMTSPDPKQETVVQTFRWRVDMTRINGDLKLTNFEWVT